MRAAQLLTQLARPGDHQRLLVIEGASLPPLVVEQCSGEEALCADFRFQIDVLAPEAELDLTPVLGQPLCLGLRLADGRLRRWHGLCVETAPLGSDGGLARYRLILAPWTHLLTLRHDARLFHDCTVQTVCEQVFAHYPNATYRFELTDALPRHITLTQYRESDAAFVFRLLAEAGLLWRFAHDETADGTHTLVIFDNHAPLPEGGVWRFHRSDITESKDSLQYWAAEARQTPNQTWVGQWQTEQLRTQAAEAGVDDAVLLEVARQPLAGSLPDAALAQAAAEQRLNALRLPARTWQAAGTVRAMAAGTRFTLQAHPEAGDYLPLAVRHVAVNNLGHGILNLLDTPELEKGSYRQQAVCVAADALLAPWPTPRPRLAGPQIATVVGLPDDTVHSSRDHQVKVLFPWARPQPEGQDDLSDQWTRWVPVAEWLAGPNWGSAFLPRVGSQVLIEHLHGDIDQPRITGQLYAGHSPPPFPLAEASNHPGTLSGWRTQAHDGGDTQQWVLDDTPQQLRQCLHTQRGEARLALGYLIAQNQGHRGALLGQGVQLHSQAWGHVRAGAGLLLSTTAQTAARATQMDLSQALPQWRGAEQTSAALHQAALSHQAATFDPAPVITQLRESVDPEVHGKHPPQVNGQAALRPEPGQRHGHAPVEHIAEPRLIAESPDRIAFTTPRSALAQAGDTFHLLSQSDTHLEAGETFAATSGGAFSLFCQQGPLHVIAAHGPASLHAHTDRFELLADQSVTLTATDNAITVLAKEKIILHAGQATITLEGGNITFACPGKFTVKASDVPFKGGESRAVGISLLPDKTTTTKKKASFSI
ncbi:type VI secretion system tip protein VgrG [Lysobacteraceae bacterium NML03-0222]|nr:type VI secretion system tip protein VgrG [Xanthomonadaceae bacterium NML03-0222]